MAIAEQRLKELGIELPKRDRRGKGIVPIQRHENLLYMTGNGPDRQGKLGIDLSIEEGYEAARETAILMLADLKEYLGDLDRVDGIVKVFGLVASAPDFYDQPKVMHGFSDLIVEVFGEKGIHARSAMGTNVLPHNMPVEVEMIVRIKD